MMHEATYTMYDICRFFLTCCTAIVTVSAAIAVIIRWVNKAKEPSTVLTKRINDHEDLIAEQNEKIKDIMAILKKDKNSIETINEGNRITQRSLLALMEFSLNDRDPSKLQDAREELQEFLIKK